MTSREILYLNHYSVKVHGSSGKASDNHIYEEESQGKQVASSSVLLPGRAFVNRPNRRRPRASPARAVAKLSVQMYGGGRQRYGVWRKDGEACFVCNFVFAPRCPKATGGIYIHSSPFFPYPIPDRRHPRQLTGYHAVLPGLLLLLPSNFRLRHRQRADRCVAGGKNLLATPSPSFCRSLRILPPQGGRYWRLALACL